LTPGLSFAPSEAIGPDNVPSHIMKLKVPKGQVHRTLNNSKGEVHYPPGFPDEFDRLLRSLHQVHLILNACPKPLTWQRIVRVVLYHGLLYLLSSTVSKS
jgi:hypothetical protein